MSSKHSDREHSEIGASAAYRWTRCPGSVKLLEQHPMPTSEVAAYGTKAHELSELMLLDKVVEYSNYDHEMIANCREYTGWIEALRDAIQRKLNVWPQLIVEQRFNMKSVSEKAFGTNDVALYCDFGPLHIIDLKYGHKFVSPVENEQLMYYALGIIEELELNPSEVHLWIYGPRMPWEEFGSSSPAMRWECPMDRLLEYHQELKDGAKRVEENPDEYVPGEMQCFYCNKAECPAIQTQLAKSFTDIEPLHAENKLTSNLSNMTTEELAERLKWKELFDGAFRDIGVILKHRAEEGESIPGHKLVRSIGHRAFKGDVATTDITKCGLAKGEVLEEPKRKSPAQIEKAIKAKYPIKTKEEKEANAEKRKKFIKHLEVLTERPDRGLKLVSSDHPGEAVTPNLTFEDVQALEEPNELDQFGIEEEEDEFILE